MYAHGPLDPSDVDLLGVLLDSKKVNVDSMKDGDTVLHLLCHERAPNNVRKIDFMCSHKANTELKNSANKMPLHCASVGKETEHVHALLKWRADVNAKGPHLSTPLMLACALGSAHENAEILLKHKADVTVRNEHGDTALNKLARLGSRNRNDPCDLALARALIDSGASLDVANDENYTPFLAACSSGKLHLLAYLIGKGARRDVKTMYNEDSYALGSNTVRCFLTMYDILVEEWQARLGVLGVTGPGKSAPDILEIVVHYWA